jgi:Family of unknown function (DUF6088)
MEVLEKSILRRVRGAGRGSLVTPNHFVDLGSRSAIDQALSRLSRAGTIKRLARGLYLFPETHAVLGELIPGPEKIAQALAGRGQAKLQPAGAYAANLLGLSEQVPAKVVFLTDGSSQTVQIGGTTIQLRRTTLRHMATAGRLSGLLIQAFRHLGQQHVTSERIEHLRTTIPHSQRQALLKDLKFAPGWIQAIFRDLAEQ